tara:strand:+ start:1442 stop:1690 length:249 start_codon:yes stop_codon:yes gene_type:complete
MAPEAEPFIGEGNPLIDKLKEVIPAINYPNATFRIESDGCEPGFIKILGLETPTGPPTEYFTCEEVEATIEIAAILQGEGPA